MEGFKFKEVGIETKGVQETEKALLDEVEGSQEDVSEQVNVQADSEEGTVKDAPISDSESLLTTTEKPLDDEAVLGYLSKKLGKDITLSMIGQESETTDVPEGVKGLMDYMSNTGRGIEDYVKLKKDYSSVKDDVLLKEYLRQTEEGLDEEDIEILYSELIVNEEEDSESEAKKKKIRFKKSVNKARKFFEERKESYKEPLVSREEIDDSTKAELENYRKYVKDSQSWEDEVQKKRSWFEQKTGDVFSENFKGFDFDIEGTQLTFKPASTEELKSRQQSPQNFVSKFLDEQGLLIDAEGYHKALSIAMNPQKFAEFFYNKGKVQATESMGRDVKNIDMGDTKNVHGSTGKTGTTMRQVNTSSGNGLKIKPFK